MENKFLKLLSYLICAMLVLSLAGPATVAGYDDGVYVQFIAPSDGETVKFYSFVDDSDRYIVSDYNEELFYEGVRIRDLTAESYISPSTVVTHEHEYKYEIVIEACEGYGFREYQNNPNVNGYVVFDTVNGYVNYPADVRWFDNNKDKIVLSCEYNVRITESINFVSMNVTAPAQGNYPSYDCEFLSDYITSNKNHDNDQYCINGITWHCVGDGGWDPLWLGQPLNKDEVFTGGQTYRLTIRITAEHDYVNDIERKFGFSFAPLAVNDRVLVNDYVTRGREEKSAPNDKYYVQSCYIIYRDFYCPLKKTVKEVALEVNPPILGENPDFNVAFATNDYKAIQDPGYDGYINGIQWRDLTTGKNMTENDMYEAGHHYSFHTYLEPANEKTAFDVDSSGDTVVSGIMNGNDVEVDSGIAIHGGYPYGNDSQAIGFYYDFGTVSNEITRISVINIEEPIAGEAADYTADIKNERLYDFDTEKDDSEVIANGISWRNITLNKYVDGSEVFEVGNQYCVFVYLTISENCTLGQTVTGSIDGKTADVIAKAGTNEIVLAYTFDEVEPRKTESNKAVGIALPVEGEHPDFDMSLDNPESTVEDIRWRDVSVSMYGDCLTAGDTFVGGHLYQLELDIVPNESYEFMTDEAGNLAFEFLFEIDGAEYEGIIEGTKDKITAVYKFASLPVSVVDISIDVPVPGFAPSFLAYTSNDACYTNEVVWYDKTDDVYITEEDNHTFVEGHVYVISVDVFAADNRCFDAYSEAFVGTINNKPAEIGMVVYKEEGAETSTIYSSFYALRFSYEFEPCVAEDVFAVEFDRLIGSVSVYHDINSAFEEDTFAVYMAFYDDEEKFVSCVVKYVEYSYDIYSETAPDDAVYCKAMLWNKKTLKPLCTALGCATIKDVQN